MTLDEQMAPAPAGRDADVGFSCLAGAVHHATHHSHLNGELFVLECLLSILRHLEHINLGAAARWAGNQVESLAFAQSEVLEQLAPCLGFLYWISRKRKSDGVTYALQQQG